MDKRYPQLFFFSKAALCQVYPDHLKGTQPASVAGRAPLFLITRGHNE
jgi:hypothetical protein